MSEQAGSASAPRGACVLVVDDDRELRETLCDLLEAEGFTTATATNGAEALAYLRSAAAPRLILLDLSMPVMDGVTFREEQRRDPAIAAIPVIVFSAAASVADRVRDLEVHGVLKKPVKLSQLINVVSQYCERATG
jgi:CheY-like chemotaxis protein